MAQDDAIVRLARQIDAARQTQRYLVDPNEVVAMRHHGAAELHRICADFVASVNSKLPEPLIDLAPPEWTAGAFQESGLNLLQISSQGRQLQIAFEAPVQLVSTEKFLVPYILEGEIRTYNQEMLERYEIRSQLLFFCVERAVAEWRSFDWRTRHTGPLNREFLVSLMEPLF